MQSTFIYAILNWGLGHATRSVPIIRELINRNYLVHLASSGDAMTYLEKQFPTLPTLTLPDYNVRYPTRFMSMNAMSFASSMLMAIHKENKLLNRYAAEHRIERIFSDNRYGAYLTGGKNYFIGHQLKIRIGNTISSRGVNFIQKQFLKHFNHILIPDFRQIPNLSGELSRPDELKNISFLGPLTSYHKPRQKPMKYRWTCILSGIEPQRTRLEKTLFNFLAENKIPAAIITGKEKSAISSGKSVKVFPLLSSDEVQEIVEESEYLCMRSGYSSIMDLCIWRKPALLIPTPGQTEQIYLAEYLNYTFNLSVIKQDDIKPEVFKKAPHKTEALPCYDESMMPEVLDALL